MNLTMVSSIRKKIFMNKNHKTKIKKLKKKNKKQKTKNKNSVFG